MNEQIIKETGGTRGDINKGNLDYLLYKSLKKEIKTNDPIHLAAGTLLGIAQAHPFKDGNKRTAYLLAKLFLMLKHLKLNINFVEAKETIIKTAIGKKTYDDVYKWLLKHSVAEEISHSEEIESYLKELHLSVIERDKK